VESDPDIRPHRQQGIIEIVAGGVDRRVAERWEGDIESLVETGDDRGRRRPPGPADLLFRRLPGPDLLHRKVEFEDCLAVEVDRLTDDGECSRTAARRGLGGGDDRAGGEGLQGLEGQELGIPGAGTDDMEGRVTHVFVSG